MSPRARLRATGGDGRVLADAPLHVDLRARDAQPDMARPAASRGVVHAAVGLGDVQVSLDATKAADAVDYALHVTAKSLKPVRPFLPPALGGVAPWDRMAVSFQSTGHVAPLGGPGLAIRHATELHVDHVAFANVSAQAISLTLKSKGTALQHQADVDLRAQGLAFDGSTPGDEHVSFSGQVDRVHPSLKFQVATDGRATTKLSGSLAFDPVRRALTYALEGHLANLAPLAPFAAKIHGLDAFDLSQLDVGLSATGAVLGVVAGVAGDGTVHLEPDVMRTAAVEALGRPAGRALSLGARRRRGHHLRRSRGTATCTRPGLAPQCSTAASPWGRCTSISGSTTWT